MRFSGPAHSGGAFFVTLALIDQDQFGATLRGPANSLKPFEKWSPARLQGRFRNIPDAATLPRAGRVSFPSVLTQPGNSPGRVCDGLDQGYLHLRRASRSLPERPDWDSDIDLYRNGIWRGRKPAYGSSARASDFPRP